MESIPEDPSCVHFFKLLALLARNNSVCRTQLHLKLPNSLLFGFGFKSPTLMQYFQYRLQFTPFSELEFEDAISHLDLYTDATRGSLPKYVFKLKGEKLFARTKDELTSLWRRLVHSSRTFHTGDFVVQPFIISKTHKACVVKLSWHLAHGASVTLHQCATELNPDNYSSLTVGEDAEVLPATLSQSTNHLRESIEYVRVIVEKAVFWQTEGRVKQLKVQFMQDVFDNW